MNNITSLKKQILSRDGDKCSICGISLLDSTQMIDYIFPYALGGTDDLNNLRLVCPKCNMKSINSSFSSYEFEKYIYDVMSKNCDFRKIELEVSIGNDKSYIADIVAERKNNDKWESIIIEIKYVTSLTIDRVNSIISKYKEIKSDIKESQFILLFPGKLAEKATTLLKQNNIEIWDTEFISTKFSTEIEKIPHPVFQSFLKQKTETSGKTVENILIDRLNACNKGKGDWSKYQKLIGEILTHLFCPPLLTPLPERADALKINRRDYILPNYCENGFWAFLRSRYNADYIVVDAKNYTEKVNKKDILQIANYLKQHGTGLFGMIISRNGIGERALYTLREVWAIENKLIIVLHDDDIEQMLLEKRDSREPENVIRQKIEDFRLSL